LAPVSQADHVIHIRATPGGATMRKVAIAMACPHDRLHRDPSVTRRGFLAHTLRLGAPITGPAADRSLIFQQHSLYPWLSALDNMAFGLMLQGVGRKERRQRAKQFLRQVGLREFAQKHPHELSGGMQQRAAIARALCLGRMCC
jgi:ABC transporter